MLSRLQQPHRLFTTDAQVKRSFHCRNNTERRMDTVEVSSVRCLPPRSLSLLICYTFSRLVEDSQPRCRYEHRSKSADADNDHQVA
jgi:hypothetical protein